MNHRQRRYRFLLLGIPIVLIVGVVMWLLRPTRGWIVRSTKSVIIYFDTRGDADHSPPAIDVWYGHSMVVGKRGTSQRWLNIPGRVTELEGAVDSLTYTLNDARNEQILSIGPDHRRLVGKGDFNIEIDRVDLRRGLNTVQISAIDESGNRSQVTVQIDRRDADSTTFVLPIRIDWALADRFQDFADVVDGLWIQSHNGIRTHPDHVGYDRLLAVGDTSWTDYQVTVPITVNDIDEDAHVSRFSASPSVGLSIRWLGHTDNPTVCPQPHCGWLPMGGNLLFDWKLFYQGESELAIYADPKSNERRDVTGLRLVPGRTYWYKASVETLTNGSRYRLKVWEADQQEPSDWMVERTTSDGNLDHGSFLINAHHVDITVGNILVERVEMLSETGNI